MENPGDTGMKYAKPVFNDMSIGSSMPVRYQCLSLRFLKIEKPNIGILLIYQKKFFDQYKINSIRLYVSGSKFIYLTQYQGKIQRVSSNGNTASGGVDRTQ